MHERTIRIYQDPRASGVASARPAALMLERGLPVNRKILLQLRKELSNEGDHRSNSDILLPLKQDPGSLLAVLRKVSTRSDI